VIDPLSSGCHADGRKGGHVAVSVRHQRRSATVADDLPLARPVTSKCRGTAGHTRQMAGIQSCLSILAAGLIFTYLVQVFRASSNGLLAALKSERLLSDLHRGGPAALAAHPVSTRGCREHPCHLRSIAAIPVRRNDRG